MKSDMTQSFVKDNHAIAHTRTWRLRLRLYTGSYRFHSLLYMHIIFGSIQNIRSYILCIIRRVYNNNDVGTQQNLMCTHVRGSSQRSFRKKTSTYCTISDQHTMKAFLLICVFK